MGLILGLAFGAGLVVVFAGGWTTNVVKPPTVAPNRVWPTFIEDVASGLRAGQNIPQATFAAGNRLPSREAAAFAFAQQEWQSSAGFVGVLDSLNLEIATRAFSAFVDLVSLAHEQGSERLPTLLTQLAAAQRAQLALIAEVKSKQSSTVNAARVAVVSPWVVLALTGSRADVRAAYLTPTGALVLVGIAAVTALSYLAMQRLARLRALEVLW